MLQKALVVQPPFRGFRRSSGAVSLLHVKVNLDAMVEARLEEVTSQLGVSKNKFIEAAIVEKLSRDGNSLLAEKIIDKVLSRDAEVLEMLGKSM